MSDTSSEPNYQDILNKYAAEINQNPPESEPAPENPAALPQPEPQPEPIAPPQPEPITPPPAPPAPPVTPPSDDLYTPLTSEPVADKGNSFFKVLFFISLFLFLGVAAAVVYSFINSQKPLSNNQDTPTSGISPTISASTCKINEQEYTVGETFTATDGCNTCTCNPDLTISCTEKACDTTPTKSATTSANQYKNTKYKYSLTFPSSWLNKYNITETSNGTKFTYKDTPDTKTTLFSISVLTKDEWAKEQSQPHGILIKEDAANDRVFIYNIALDTIFTGQKADDFSKMSGDIKQIISTFKFL